MNWILNFLLILAVEYLQNIPMMAGVVAGLSGMKRGLPWWKWFPICLGGSFACAIVISSTEWIKELATTRAASQSTFVSALQMGIIFSAVCGLTAVYLILTSHLRRPFMIDVVFGILVGMAIALAQEVGKLSPILIALHALGFAATGSGLMILVRRSAEVAPGWKMLAWIGWLTLLMSVVIVLFDYLPFLRN